MKKFSKIVLATASVLAVGSAAFNVLMAQPHTQASNLTRAAPCKENMEFDGLLIIVTVCDRTTTLWDDFRHVKCASESDGPCTFSNVK